MTTNVTMKTVVGLDKLAMTVTPPDMAPYANYEKELWGMAQHGVELADAPDAKASYRTAVRIKVPFLPTGARPLLQVGPRKKGWAYMRLEFNPNSLGAAGIASTKDILDLITPQGWPLFLYQGRVTRVDVNIDVHGLPLDRVLLRTAHPRYVQTYTDSGELDSLGVGDVQTVYLGKKDGPGKSKGIFRVYRLGLAKVDVGYETATRFENVDTMPLKLAVLHDYNFPFTKLIVQSTLAKKPASWHAGHWTMFIRFAYQNGLQVALAHLTTNERVEAKAALAASPIVDLDLIAAWSQWKPLIAKFGLQTPGSQGGFLTGYAPLKKVA